jgi:hypothetical protein
MTVEISQQIAKGFALADPNPAVALSIQRLYNRPDQTRYFGLDEAAGSTQNSSELSLKDVDTT